MTFPTFIEIADSPRLDDVEPLALKEHIVHTTVPPAESTTVASVADESASLVSGLSETELGFRVKSWDKKTRYADFIAEALRYLNKSNENTIMLFESPSSSNRESVYFNSQTFKFHDYPPASNAYKTMLGPCRYSMMNGSTFPSYLQDGAPPAGMMEHWEKFVPGFTRPRFVTEIPNGALVYAYLPCESLENHMNDPYVHYHLAGKDALHLMSPKTPKLLNNTHVKRPCIAKTTHSMGSKGIFVIHNDEDEAEFEAFLAESGNPTFVVTEFVEIDRNVACHFFIHPNGDVTWFGSNENYRDAEGRWSMDSYLIMPDQQKLKELQLPYVMDVVKYAHSLGFFGFAGIDVLFDKDGNGYLVDLNPRVTGSCPSLMIAQLLKDKYGFDYGLFRRNGNITYHGTTDELFQEVEKYNETHEGNSQIILFGACQDTSQTTKINIGIYGNSLEECRAVLSHFAQSDK